MSQKYLFLFMVSLCISFTPADTPLLKHIQGEQLTYVAQVGEGVVGEATISVSKELHSFNNTNCFKIEAEGKSIGLVDAIAKIRNKFDAYVDASSLRPQRFTMHLNEGSYVRNTQVKFANGQAIETNLDNPKEVYSYNVPYQIHDIVSGFYYLRSLPFDSYTKGTIGGFPVFFGGKTVYTKFKYLGKSTINTKLGRKSAHVLQPIVSFNPDAKIVEESIRVWIADDETKLPLKVFAKTENSFLSIDLKSYKKGI